MQTNEQGMSIRWLLTASFINSVAFVFIWQLTSVDLQDDLYQELVIIGWVMMANDVSQSGC